MCVPLPLCPVCNHHVFRPPCMVCFARRLAELERKTLTPMPQLADFLKETPDVLR